jgi:tetratricopeptide (TPR) repeat protein
MLTAHLAALEASGLIRLAEVEPEIEYLFRHALVQDAAYASLLKADRRVLHRAVGEALERLYPGQLASRELAPVLARHFREAGDAERAFKYYALAGEAALGTYANAEAEAHYRAALSLATAEADKARALSGMGEALFRQSRFEDAISLWREAITHYRVLGDHDGVARMYTRSAVAAGVGWGAGDARRGLALCREGLAAVAGQPENPAVAALLHETGRACYFSGLPEEASAFCQQSLEMAERVKDVETQAEALTTLGMLWFPRQYVKGIEAMQRAVELAESAGLLPTAARAHHNLGDYLFFPVGDFRAGREHLIRSAELYRRMGAASSDFFSLCIAVQPLLFLGDFSTAEEACLTLRQWLGAAGLRLEPLMLQLDEAMLARYRGEWENAAGLLRACETEARRQRDLQVLLWAESELAEMLLEQDEPEAAIRMLIETIEIGEQLGPATWPLCLLSAAYARQGRIEDALQLLAEAHKKAGPQLAPMDEGFLSLTAARLAAAERRWPDALAAFDTAARLQAGMTMRWYRAQTLREWAEAHLSRNEPGDRERAIGLLREALVLFEVMDVPKYAERVRERLEGFGED